MRKKRVTLRILSMFASPFIQMRTQRTFMSFLSFLSTKQKSETSLALEDIFVAGISVLRRDMPRRIFVILVLTDVG